MQLLACTGRIPLLGHHVGAPVVNIIELAFNVTHRAAVEIQLALGEPEAQTRRTVLAIVDAIAAEHQKMNAQREVIELDQKMLAPAAKGTHSLADQPGLVDFRAVTLDAQDLPAGEAFDLFLENDNGRTFRHVPAVAGFVRGASTPLCSESSLHSSPSRSSTRY